MARSPDVALVLEQPEGRRGGEHTAYCSHPLACHLACNVRMHCVSRNLECPALSVENRLLVQFLSLSSGEEPRGHWLSPDRTKLGLLDSDGQERGGCSDLIWCQALEIGADRMEQVKLCHSLCSLRTHQSGYEVRWLGVVDPLKGFFRIPSPEFQTQQVRGRT